MPSKSIESLVIEVLQDFIDEYADIDEFESYLESRVREDAAAAEEDEEAGEDEEEEG